MRSKLSYSKFFLYVAIIIVIGILIYPKRVQASQIEKSDDIFLKVYNTETTNINNKFNINGKLLYGKIYKDYFVIVTDKSIYEISDNKIFEYDTKNLSFSNIELDEDNIRMSGLNEGNALTIFDIQNDSNEIRKVKQFDNLKFDKNQFIYKEGLIDQNNNVWLSLIKQNNIYSENISDYIVHKLIKVDERGNSSEIISFNNPPQIFYKNSMTNLKEDKDGNIWFYINKQDCYEENDEYRIGRVSQNGNVDYFDFKNEIKNYIVLENELWALMNNEIIVKMDTEEKSYKEYKLKGVKDITKDINDDVWILQDNKIKKYSNNEFVEKYQVKIEANKLDIYNQTNILAYGFRDFDIIKTDKNESIKVSSYIKENSFVINNKNDDLFILNCEKDSRQINYKDKDTTLAITKISDSIENNDIQFNSEFILNGIYVPFYHAKAWDDKIFIPCMNKIYIINNGIIEDYVVLYEYFSNGFNKNIKQIEIDLEGNIYAISDDVIYFIDKNKNISSLNVEEFTKELPDQKQMIFSKIIIDKNDNTFVSLTIANNNKIIYKLDYNEECNSLIYNKVDNQNIKLGNKIYYSKNIFLDYNKEIQMVFHINDENKVYNFSDTMVENEIFSSENKKINIYYDTITCMERAGDGSVFLIMDYELYMKHWSNKDFRKVTEEINFSYVTSLAHNKKGEIYIGTYDDGVYYYEVEFN